MNIVSVSLLELSSVFCFSKCGSWPSGISITWKLVETQAPGEACSYLRVGLSTHSAIACHVLVLPGPAVLQGPLAFSSHPGPELSWHTQGSSPMPRILLPVISCHLFSRLCLGASRSMRETASSSVIPSSR